jgi:hypothetical protein
MYLLSFIKVKKSPAYKYQDCCNRSTEIEIACHSGSAATTGPNTTPRAMPPEKEARYILMPIGNLVLGN